MRAGSGTKVAASVNAHAVFLQIKPGDKLKKPFDDFPR